MQLPGGITIDGQSIYAQGLKEQKDLEVDIMEKQSPLSFFMGWVILKINIPLCLDIYSQIFNGLSEDQINGFKEILSNINSDNHITNPQWVAYMLATTWHETAFTMKPIDEYGSTSYFENGTDTKLLLERI